jgi:23S rRNA pseudouridine1911/1915/1917 synthase
VRLDVVLAGMPSVGSRRRAQQAVETGKVRIDGTPCPPDQAGRRVVAGQRVGIDWNTPGSSLNLRQVARGLTDAGLVVLYQDDVLVALDKPAGLLTDTATYEQNRNRDSLRRRLATWLKVQGDSLHLVHRIDRDTSGVVLAARSEQAALHLKGQFERREPDRLYRTWLQGVPSPSEGMWEDWMDWDSERRVQHLTSAGAPGAVLAASRYRVVRTFAGRASEVEVRLVSGRRNQIRLQCQLRGYPLIGEQLYLPDGHRSTLVAPRQALHAAMLAVDHPTTGKRLVIESPLPDDLLALERKLSGLEQRSGRRR